MRKAFRQTERMRSQILPPAEVPRSHYIDQVTRRRTPRDGSGADSTTIRIGRDLALGAHGRDSAHCGSVHGAVEAAARPADGARTGLAQQNTPTPAFKTNYYPELPTRLGFSRRREHRAHPDLHPHTASSARVSCGATRGPVLFKSVPGSQNDWPYAGL